jgi:4-amino-4-deoxy-L-arabinose transferase-like glycosyltransferase
LAVFGAVYLYGLDHAPVYLGGDEAHFAVHGHAIAQDGRNLDGMRFPLFVNLWDPLGDQQPLDLKKRWYQPMLFYITALELTVLPLNEWTLRLPVALIAGLLIPWMMFMVGRRLLRDEQLALLAAGIVALSPTHLILGRQALDYVLPLPFVLGWLWYLLAYLENGRPRDAFIGGVLLGVGFYSYIASWIFMPLCLALGWVAYARSRHGARQACLWSAAGFALPLLPALPWFAAHPEMLRDTFARYQTDSTNTTTLVERITAVVFSRSWSTKLQDYASFFNPVILFVRGGPVPTTSLGRAGFFLLPVAVLLPIGLIALLKRRMAAGSALVLVAGLLLSPVPALFAGEPGMIQRSLFMLPFAAFIAAAGGGALRDSARGWLRTGAVLLVAAMPVQFAYVYFDYFTHYKLRSAFYYDAVAFGTVADHLVAAASTRDIPAVYLMHDLDDAGSKWRFYLIKHRREDLLTKTHYVDAGDAVVASPPPGAYLVMYSAQQVLKDLLASGRWRVVRSILDVDNREAAIILEATEPPR